MSQGSRGALEPARLPFLPQAVSCHGPAACFSPCMPGKTMRVPPAPGPWQALLRDRDAEWWTGVPCVSSGNKAPGLQIHPAWEVLLASGRCCLQEKAAQQPWHSQGLAPPLLPAWQGRGAHPSRPTAAPVRRFLLALDKPPSCKDFKNLPSLAEPLWVSKTGWRITRSCLPSSWLVLPAGVRNTSCPAPLTGISAVSLPHPAHGKTPAATKCNSLK